MMSSAQSVLVLALSTAFVLLLTCQLGVGQRTCTRSQLNYRQQSHTAYRQTSYYYTTRCGFWNRRRCGRTGYRVESYTAYNAVGVYSTVCCSGYTNSGCTAYCSQGCYNFGTCVTPGYCSCTDGWNGISCSIDIDECALDLDVCHDNATCGNTPGSYDCICDTGFQGDGYNCTDVDECALDLDVCHDNATCGNTPGSYDCICDTGFQGDGYNCTDVDECTLNNGGCHHNCHNEIGSYYCSCSGGYQLNSDGHTCEVPPPPPINMQVPSIGSQTANVTWEVPVIDFLNNQTMVSSYQLVATQEQFNIPDIVVDLDGNTSYAFPDTLEEYTLYSCTVRAANDFGLGNMSLPVEFKTLQVVPSAPPQNAAITARSPTLLTLTWLAPPPIHINGVLQHYMVKVTETNTGCNWTFVAVDASLTVGSLHPYYYYCSQVAAYTTGLGPFTATFCGYTDEAAPNGSPTRPEILTHSSRSVDLRWQPPAIEERNGIIRYYTISATEVDTGQILEFRSNTTSTTLQPLHPFYTYIFTVRAVTVGPGPYSPQNSVQLEEEAPSGPPQRVSGVATSSRVVSFSWMPPEFGNQNGQIRHYSIAITEVETGDESFYTTTSLRFTATSLHPAYTYSCVVSAVTVGVGPASEAVSVTALEAPAMSPQNLTATATTSTSIMLTWTTVPPEYQNGVIIGYIINVTLTATGETFQLFSDTTSLLADSFVPHTTYSFIVAAQTGAGIGPFSEAVSTTTPEDPYRPYPNPYLYPYDPYEPYDAYDPYPYYFCELNEDEYGRPYYGPYDEYRRPYQPPFPTTRLPYPTTRPPYPTTRPPYPTTRPPYPATPPPPYVFAIPAPELDTRRLELATKRKRRQSVTLTLPSCITSNECYRQSEACSGSGTQYDSCGRRCTCRSGRLVNCCRVRKEWHSMTQAERCNYVQVVYEASTQQPWKGCYDELIKIHRDNFGSGIHNQPFFLPWHRWFILALENLLRQINCTITVPYWDWSLEPQSWQNSIVWAEQCGLGGNGDPSNDDYVSTGVFREGNWGLTPSANQDTGGSLQRAFQGNLPDCASVAMIQRLGVAEFNAWHNFARSNLHDAVHCNIGVTSTMCSVDAANAPEFFLHHGLIDKIWADWQNKGPAFKNLPYYTQNSDAMPGASGYSPSDVYNLDSQPGCVRVCVQHSSRPCRINTTYTPCCPREMSCYEYSPLKLAYIIPRPYPAVPPAAYELFHTPYEVRRTSSRFTSLFSDYEQLRQVLQSNGYDSGSSTYRPPLGELQFDRYIYQPPTPPQNTMASNGSSPPDYVPPECQPYYK